MPEYFFFLFFLKNRLSEHPALFPSSCTLVCTECKFDYIRITMATTCRLLIIIGMTASKCVGNSPLMAVLHETYITKKKDKKRKKFSLNILVVSGVLCSVKCTYGSRDHWTCISFNSNSNTCKSVKWMFGSVTTLDRSKPADTCGALCSSLTTSVVMVGSVSFLHPWVYSQVTI